MIARASTAQDDITGDGTTSTVLLIGELLKQAELFVAEVLFSYLRRYCRDSATRRIDRFQGVHPRLITEGFEWALVKVQELLERFKVQGSPDRALLVEVARTSLRTKLAQKLADHMTSEVVDAVLAIRGDVGTVPDLHMIEIMASALLKTWNPRSGDAS
jgi:T-complex protein 1 subunit zeta